MGSGWFFVDVFVKGGPVMIPILLCSIVALAIVIQRYRFFQSITLSGEGFMRRVKSALSGRDYVEAM
ncbi:MAG TPA: hypothetical protein PKO06_09845, partial [Candidatus Ozemobacteraceae bacterium]|nr:hypothetical protein [Candidatus Ozemobacteraceae bacterium]